MKITPLTLWLSLVVGIGRIETAAGAELPAHYFDNTGPTELQDSFLPAQLRYQSYPESAQIAPKGEWAVSLTEDWTAHLARTETYLFDGESITSTLRIRHSPFEKWEFGVDLPYVVRIDGSADEFIEFVETTLNARVDARYTLPRDTYQASVITPKNDVLLLRKDYGFQDISLRAKYQLTRRQTHWLDSALVAAVALPSGSEGFGGDGISPSLGLHLQKPIYYFNFFGGVSSVYYPKNVEQDLEFESVRAMGYAGTTWKPFNWGALVFVYQVYSPLTVSNPPLNEPAHYYSVTGRFWLCRNAIFEAGVVENLGLIENRNSSDVTFKFSLQLNF
ncbi:MAG: DUF3187 family protein [Verrucomicrobiales bacterium]